MALEDMRTELTDDGILVLDVFPDIDSVGVDVGDVERAKEICGKDHVLGLVPVAYDGRWSGYPTRYYYEPENEGLYIFSEGSLCEVQDKSAPKECERFALHHPERFWGMLRKISEHSPGLVVEGIVVKDVSDVLIVRDDQYDTEIKKIVPYNPHEDLVDSGGNSDFWWEVFGVDGDHYIVYRSAWQRSDEYGCYLATKCGDCGEWMPVHDVNYHICDRED
jgi:hypothetical protein